MEARCGGIVTEFQEIRRYGGLDMLVFGDVNPRWCLCERVVSVLAYFRRAKID